VQGSAGASLLSSLVVGLGQCAVGKYGNSATGLCTNCPPGLYGSAVGLTSSACMGPCNGGRYGSNSGQTSSNCNGACGPGNYCPPGSVALTPCPPGQWSGNYYSSCTLCPPDKPYSLQKSGDATNCTACLSGCESGLYGAPVCPNASAPSWVAWYDLSGVEGNNSCLLYNASGLAATTPVSQACASSGPGAHLLTSAQVGRTGGGGSAAARGWAGGVCPAPLPVWGHRCHGLSAASLQDGAVPPTEPLPPLR
jgi:hypothetical protein